MAIEVLYDPDRHEGCLCSPVTGQAFGPVLSDLESREQLEHYAHVVERFLADGGDPDQVGMLIENLHEVRDWPLAAQLQCLHCEAVVDPVAVKQAMDAASWHLFEPTVRAACPACGRGDGDFQEVDVCGYCEQPISDMLVHARQCASRNDARRVSKPPLPSVRASQKRGRRFA